MRSHLSWMWGCLLTLLVCVGCEPSIERGPAPSSVSGTRLPAHDLTPNRPDVGKPNADPGADLPAGLPGLSQVDPDERPEVIRIVGLIRVGGPFQYPEKDGSVFGNFERRLPIRPRGYYREYTVPTPGVSHRGPRRIVGGRERELYYTRDHYESFVRLTP